MAGYILILAIIILGGTIATVGDRLGSRVGKARLSLFNLRPKKTAVLVTILTGSIISASTLGILFATSKELRDAVFRIESIQKQRRAAEAELGNALKQKNKIQGELAEAKTDLAGARKRLRSVNQSLETAIAKQKKTQNQLNQLRSRYFQAQADLKRFSEQARILGAKITSLAAEEKQLRVERQRLVAQLDQAEIQEQQLESSVTQARARLQQAETQKQQLETAIAQAQARLQQAEREQVQLENAVAQAQESLKQANTQRATLLNQQSKLKNEISSLEENRKRLEKNVEVLLLGLRRGNITIRTGQVLAAGVVRDIKTRQLALQAIEQLLREARKSAIILMNPRALAPEQQVVQIANDNVEQLVNQISDGKSYVVRVLSAANYLEGETFSNNGGVLVVAQAFPNQVVFPAGEQVATVSLNPANMTDEQILDRLDYLFTISNRRAIQSGILPDPLTGSVGSFRQIDLIKFVLELKKYNGNIDVAAIAPQAIYTSGPLSLELVAVRNNQVILRSS